MTKSEICQTSKYAKHAMNNAKDLIEDINTNSNSSPYFRIGQLSTTVEILSNYIKDLLYIIEDFQDESE